MNSGETINVIDHEWTDNIVCPWCGWSFEDDECSHVNSDNEVCTCEECEKDFRISASQSINYSTDKKDIFEKGIFETFNKTKTCQECLYLIVEYKFPTRDHANHVREGYKGVGKYTGETLYMCTRCHDKLGLNK